MFTLLKTKDEQVMTQYCKIKVFSGVILHGASYEPEAYLEPSQTSTRERFCKNS